MNTVDRLLLLVFSIVVAVFSFSLLLLALPFIPVKYVEVLRLFIFESNIMALLAIILLLLSLKFIFKSTESGSNYSNYVSKETEYGEIRISYNTIKTVALSSIKGINEIKEAKAQINDRNGEVSILINAAFSTGAIIPQISRDIQKKVKELVEATTEISVKEVLVFVEENNNSSKRRVG